jgi:hypothetical protein
VASIHSPRFAASRRKRERACCLAILSRPSLRDVALSTPVALRTDRPLYRPCAVLVALCFVLKRSILTARERAPSCDPPGPSYFFAALAVVFGAGFAAGAALVLEPPSFSSFSTRLRRNVSS